MTIATILAQDAVNAGNIPGNVLAAGYDTGSGVAWSAANYAAHSLPYPAIHIDQDPNASDPKADVLDVEAMAATLDEIVGWIARARASYNNNDRPGQRWPAIYLSMGNLDTAIADLQKAGVTNVPFWTAQPSLGLQAAITRVSTATGPYPCVGVQYEFGNSVDYDVFSLPWVTTVSGLVKPPPPPTPVTLSQSGWKWCNKCQGLFFGPNMAHSVCPAGNSHSNIGSGDYTITDHVA